ncbi:tyrosine-type recombinase/integrase [Thauera sp. WH-2]|uniref:tyrosine-type recombinase/integrase n=1 Tax=Thauera sp. WH-2 TaxID=3401574 RepID=UPI003AB0073F
MGFTSKQVDKMIREGKPGAYADDDGLYLKIGTTGSASWQYRYQINGKRRMMGLGSCANVGLAEAREKAADARKQVKQGIDPLEVKEAEQTAVKAKATTFRELATEYIADHRPGWRNAKHGQQWENTLAQYAFPKIGDKPIAEISTEDVLGILKKLWTEKPETASRLRNRIELVIDAGRAKGLSTAANPAAWRGHLDKLLPKRTKASKGHHAAMDYRELPAFYKRLTEDRDSLSSVALQITILTACRTSEVLLADWSEFDLDNRLWTIPGERMKAGRPHRVPLSDEVLKLLQGIKGEGYVFPGAREGRPLSNMAMTMVLRRLGHPELTVHGFRSTFRDWCAEETHYPNIVAEQALAHTVGNAVEAAYRRGDLLDKRRALMADWATYCTTKPAANVVPITSKTAA